MARRVGDPLEKKSGMKYSGSVCVVRRRTKNIIGVQLGYFNKVFLKVEGALAERSDDR